MIDIHMHTKYSDGTDSVKDILKKCQSSNLEVISITDHNTCNAYLELETYDFEEYYKGNIIVGCEFTTSYKGRLIEVLGYGFDYNRVSKFLNQYYNESKLSEDTLTLYNRFISKVRELGLVFKKKNIGDKYFNNEFFEKDIYDELVKHVDNNDIFDEDILSSFSDFF